jgi:hypothetical protein
MGSIIRLVNKRSDPVVSMTCRNCARVWAGQAGGRKPDMLSNAVESMAESLIRAVDSSDQPVPML